MRAGAFMTRSCPRCGARGLFDGILRIKPRCPRCGFRLEREEGGFLGAMTVNFAIVTTATGSPSASAAARSTAAREKSCLPSEQSRTAHGLVGWASKRRRWNGIGRRGGGC